jgi:hypothetical protein
VGRKDKGKGKRERESKRKKSYKNHGYDLLSLSLLSHLKGKHRSYPQVHLFEKQNKKEKKESNYLEM